MRQKRFSRQLAFALLLGTAFGWTACDPDGTDIGDLYGRWKIESIASDAGPIDHNDTIFIAFQGRTYQLQAGWGHHDWGPYEMTADSIYLYPLASRADLSSLGISKAFGTNHTQSAGFRIEALDNDDLLLGRNDTLWHFSKFLE